MTVPDRTRDGLRVLIVVQNLPLAVDRRVRLECHALIRAGYGVSVICPRGAGEPRYRCENGIVVRSYRPAPRAGGLLGYVLEFLYCWIRTAVLSLVVAVREGFDVLQACNPPDTYWALALPYKLFGKRYVYDQHDLCPEVYSARFGRTGGRTLGMLLFLERRAYRTADRVISTNGSYREIALVRGGVEPADISIVRSGPDADEMRRGPESPALRHGRKHLCCYLGIMGPQDGVDVLLRSVDHYVHVLGRHDAHFALLGFGDCLEQLRRQCAALDLEKYVSFPGKADGDMIAAYLSTAAVGLQPDPVNAFTDASTMNKTLEYMAYGLPVVAYDLRETRVSAGRAGVYVAAGDEHGYARGLADLLDDAERRTRLGREGRARIERALAWRFSERVYVRLYDDLFDVLTPAADDARVVDLREYASSPDVLELPADVRPVVVRPPGQRQPVSPASAARGSRGERRHVDAATPQPVHERGEE